MSKLKANPNKVLFAFVNGAVCVFNLLKKSIEYCTEAGHAETVFDLRFCPNDREIIASCSYDGTVRIWNVN